MTGLVFKLRAPLTERIDAAGLVPSALAGRSLSDIQRMVVAHGHTPRDIGDLFYVSGSPGDRLVFDGGSDRLDGIGSGLDSGAVVVDGDVGMLAARGMRGGRLEIRGSAGDFLASGMKGGVVVVRGSAGARVGAARAGERFGMSGGTVAISGDAGERAGDRMRRGSIVVRGRCGAAAGARMMGGTIIAERGFGSGPGPLLRRGSLIGATADDLLPTFGDCGWHDLGVLRLLNRHLSAVLGDDAPAPLPGKLRRLAGDLAALGRGELLLTT